MKSRLEFVKGGLHASRVCAAFVASVSAALPKGAFKELDELRPEQMESWASLHGVNAPCIIEAFAHLCSGGWTRFRRFESGSGWVGPTIPAAWLDLVANLNALPLNPWFFKGVFADVDDLTEGERRQLRSKLRSEDRPLPPVGSPFLSPEAIERCLPPIAADPAKESLEEFEIRARLHWKARAELARGLGATSAGTPAEWPNMKRDVDWLVRYQVNRETYGDIAASEGLDSATESGSETVKQATTRVARMIGLVRPRGRAAKTARRK